MSINYNPKIITDGLVLCLDAVNPKSYPGTGNIWYDLSPKKNNATLVNSPAYANGALQFRSALSQHASATFDEGVLKATNESGGWTIEVTFKYAAAPANNEAVIAGRSGCHGGIYANLNNQLHHAIKTNLCWTGHSSVVVAPMVVGRTYHSTMVYSSGVTRSYINGAFVGSAVLDLVTYDLLGYSNTFFIGGIPGYLPNVDLSSVKCYSRALIADEINQNFNATRGRFGI